MNTIHFIAEYICMVTILALTMAFMALMYLMMVSDSLDRKNTEIYFKGKIESARYHQPKIDKANQLAPLTK